MQGQFRTDLALGAILPDYDWVLNDVADAGEDWSGENPTVPQQRTHDDRIPYVVGNGPIECSTCVALEPTYPPSWVWDVNGWYDLLGVSFRASKRELRDAYLASLPDPRRTYALKQLLNADVRREYDLLPQGSLYLDDPWAQAELKRRAQAVASQRTTNGFYTTLDAVLREWGFGVEQQIPNPFEDSPSGLLDERSEAWQDPEESRYTTWVYAFYRWRTDRDDTDALATWQSLLVSACAEMRETVHLRVGYISSPYPYYVQIVEEHPVVFLDSSTTPTPDLAASAVTELLSYL